jgi:hypothetical protein
MTVADLTPTHELSVTMLKVSLLQNLILKDNDFACDLFMYAEGFSETSIYFIRLHGGALHNTAVFFLTAMITSNIFHFTMFLWDI